MKIVKNRMGLTPVIATVILCGVVLVTGISVWSIAHNIGSSMRSDYIEDVQEKIDIISERFSIEHLSYDNNTDNFDVWIYNWGTVDIEADIYVRGDAEGSNATSTLVLQGELVKIRVPLEVNVGNSLSITVMTRRQNLVYGTYVINALES